MKGGVAARDPTLADMSFEEGLERLIQTKPEEVKPCPRQEAKDCKGCEALGGVTAII